MGIGEQLLEVGGCNKLGDFPLGLMGNDDEHLMAANWDLVYTTQCTNSRLMDRANHILWTGDWSGGV